MNEYGVFCCFVVAPLLLLIGFIVYMEWMAAREHRQRLDDYAELFESEPRRTLITIRPCAYCKENVHVCYPRAEQGEILCRECKQPA